MQLTLPHNNNLPENAEASKDIPLNKFPDFRKAYDGLQEAVIRFLETSTPNCIIYDIFAKLGISRALFSTVNAFTGGSTCWLGWARAHLQIKNIYI